MSKNSFLPSKIFFIIFYAVLFSLLLAFFLEFALNLKPCILCIYQRYIYFVILIICLVQILSKKYFNLLLYLLFIAIIAQIILVIYHLGIEYGYIQQTLKCSNNITAGSIEELKELILNDQAGSCSQPTKILLNISITELNLVYSGILSILITYSIRRKNEITRR
jgi:disulfide bond formation protein DsbB